MTSSAGIRLVALSLLLAHAGPGRAEEAAEMKPVREAFPQKRQGCFLRDYDRAHLAANPEQSVTSIALARLAAERRREDVDGPEAPTVALRLVARLRGGARVSESLDCESVYPTGAPVYLWCRSTCNRGRIDLTPLGPDSVRISIGGQAGGRFVADAIGAGRRCDRDDGVHWIGDRAGDRIFILSRAPTEACR